MQWSVSPHSSCKMPAPEGMGDDDVVQDVAQLSERMATMASALGARTEPVGSRPMHWPPVSQCSVHRPVSPAGAAAEVHVEPPSVVAMK